MPTIVPCFIRSHDPSGGPVVRLGVPLLAVDDTDLAADGAAAVHEIRRVVVFPPNPSP